MSLSPSPPPARSTRHAKNVLKNLQRNTRKNDPDNELQEYIDYARWIPLTINPFIDLGSVFFAGLDPSSVIDKRDDADQLLNEFRLITAAKPRIEEVLYHINQDPTQLTAFINKLVKFIWSARVDDTGSLKSKSLAYILPTLQDVLDPKIPDSGSKACRGFNNRTLARMLCPATKLGVFDADPDKFMTDVQEGRRKIKAKHWPTFLYDMSAMDKEDILKGFMRGFYLVRVYRSIFTGPSSAMTGNRRASKPSKAGAHALTSVTPRTLAYAAVQARFAISSVESWSVFDATFDYEIFFNNIVAQFEDEPNHPWVIETLDWWNKQLPDLNTTSKKRKRGVPADDVSDEESDDDGVLDMRNAMRARMAQVAAETGEDDSNILPPSSSNTLLPPSDHHQHEDEPRSQNHSQRKPRDQRKSQGSHQPSRSDERRRQDNHSFSDFGTPDLDRHDPTPSPSPRIHRLHRRRSRSEQPREQHYRESPFRHSSSKQTYHRNRSQDRRRVDKRDTGSSTRHLKDTTNMRAR